MLTHRAAIGVRQKALAAEGRKARLAKGEAAGRSMAGPVFGVYSMLDWLSLRRAQR